jgi:hypothetical protein
MKIVCGNQNQVYGMNWVTRTRQVRQYAVYQVLPRRAPCTKNRLMIGVRMTQTVRANYELMIPGPRGFCAKVSV